MVWFIHYDNTAQCDLVTGKVYDVTEFLDGEQDYCFFFL